MAKRLIVCEPFYGGSHKQLLDVLERRLLSHCEDYAIVTLPARKVRCFVVGDLLRPNV